jgi:hypothetical protein
MSRAGTGCLVLVVTCLAACAVLSALANGRHAPEGDVTRMREPLLQVMALPTVALSADCSATRNLTEGLGACLSDSPAGYCYHSSCDTLCAPDALPAEVFRMRLQP